MRRGRSRREEIAEQEGRSVVHIPAGDVHGFRVESETARFLILTTPHHGEMYREISVPALTDGSRPDDTSTAGGAGARYGVEFVGPLPS